MSRNEILNHILECGIVAIIRMQKPDKLLKITEAIYRGGLTAIEITLTTPDALTWIRRLSDRLGDVIRVGAGSVINTEAVYRARDAGATYIISPVLKTEIIHAAHQLDMPAIPGCFTPTEILAAHEAGADLIKVFPAEFHGPRYIKAIKAPLPQVALMPTGGITVQNAIEWIRAGASCLGVGSCLLDKQAIAENDFSKISAQSGLLKESVIQARSENQD